MLLQRSWLPNKSGCYLKTCNIVKVKYPKMPALGTATGKGDSITTKNHFICPNVLQVLVGRVLDKSGFIPVQNTKVARYTTTHTIAKLKKPAHFLEAV